MSPGRSGSISEREVRSLLAREEGQFLEFKSLWDQSGEHRRVLDRRQVRDEIAEQVAAFANADGGILLLGVDDDGSPKGHGYPEEAIAEFLAVAERRLRPPVLTTVTRMRMDGVEILAIEVPMAAEAVMVEANGFPYRAGDRVIREPQEVINERKTAYRRVGFEQQTRPEATLDDLDVDLAAGFLQHTPYAGRPLDEALARYGLIQTRAGGWGVTNAALLLFGKVPLARWHPRCGIRLFRVAASERRHGVDRNVSQLARIDLPIARLIVEAHRVAREQIRRSEKLHDLFFRETPEYPEFAWQEAIVNAVAHRDYGLQGQEIEVWFYDDRMEVSSPGALIPPVTLAVIRERQRVHASRNPLIVRVLVEAGIMREEGEGIPRMFEEMTHSFLRAPEFEEPAGSFSVTLRNQPVFEGPSQEWSTLVRSLPLSVPQQRVLLARPTGFTNEDYRTLNNVDRDQAYREIQELVAKGVVLAPHGLRRGATYRISPDLHEARLFLEKRLPGLREHFRSQPFIRNEDYRGLFGISRHTALRELRRLVESGYLRSTGARKGARYEPEQLLLSQGG